MNKLLTLANANRHVSGAALIFVSAKFGALIGAIWFPAYADKCKQTADAIEGAAVAYGLIASNAPSPMPDTNKQPQPPAKPSKPDVI
jgi:hypothetical protein